MTSTAHGRGRGFRRAKLAAFLVPLALVLAACGGNDDGTGGSGGAAEPVGKITILLPFNRSIAFWPVHVAEEQGYFKDAGLDVTSEATDGSSFVVQQIAAGKSPVGIAVAEPVLLGYEQNANFSSVYEFLTGNVFDLWVPSDSAVQKIGDLPKGSAIAIKEQSGGEVPRLNAALEKAGLKPGADIDYKYFGENASVAANMLAKGDAAAMMISWNSLVGVKQALSEQGKELRCVTCSASDSLASESVIVNNKFLADHKDVVEKLGRAIAQGTVFGQTNPEAALALMKKVNPEEQVDAAYAKAYFDAAVEITKPRQPTNKFGWQDPAAYQRSMDLLLTPGNPSGLAGPVDLGKVVNNDLVDAYNNFDKAAVETAAKQATG
jgi:ABC-type nitrate/sulfonate/bicarbonate transport system substrate-binding protein